MKLPGGENAIIDARKISEYILSLTHPRGRHKARVFRAALGLDRTDSTALTAELRRAASEADATLVDADIHGQRFVIDFVMVHQGRQAVVRSHWIAAGNGALPRFVTAFVRD